MDAFRGLEPAPALLFPHAFAGRETLIDALRGQGCQVDVVAGLSDGPAQSPAASTGL